MNRQNLIILIISVIIAGGYIWWQSSGGAPATNVLETDTEFQSKLSEFRRLKDISLDVYIIKDPFFQSLQPVSEIPTLAAKVGRANPFTPF